VGNGSGGNVTLVTGATASDTITIIRSVPLTQETDYVENDSFPAETHEEALDKLTMQIQELNERMDRALILDVDSTSTGLTFPDPIAGNFIQWNSGGTGFENQSALGTLGSVFNEAGAAVDFRVESDTLTHAIFVDGSADTVTIVGTVFSATGVVDGRTIATDGTKLDTIETNADVTDYTNVSGVLAAPSANLVFNESAGDYDLRIEGTTATGLLFVDAGSNRVGVSAGASSLITDGLFHIASGSAGVVVANAVADDLVIEGNTGVGMSFLSDATSVQRITYGDPGSNLKAQIFYNHNADVWSVFTDSDDQLSIYAATGTVFNEGGVASLDFRVEGDTSDHLFFVDAGNNRAGVSLSGNLVTDGLFHIASGSAGVVTASGDGDELVLEGSGNSGLTILSGAANAGHIYFGDSGSATIGDIQYNHSLERMFLIINNTQCIDITSSEVVINETGSAGPNFRVEGDTSTHLLFCDAGNNRAGVSLSGNLVTDGLFHIASGSSGVVAADTGGDELVLEASGHGGLSILTPAANSGFVYFGSPTSPTRGKLEYDHPNDRFIFQIESTKLPLIVDGGEVVVGEQVADDVNFRVRSALNSHMFFVDVGNNSVHIDNSLLTGAGDGDLVMANNKAIRFVNNAGTTSANFGISGGTGDDLLLAVPATTDTTTFQFAGSSLGWIRSENGGMGITFGAESSADHTAPSANRAVIYTKDNGAGKTQLAVRFNTGAVQILATEP
jgi:hypothetical protein